MSILQEFWLTNRIAIIAGLITATALFPFLGIFKKPKEKDFVCVRCKKKEPHTSKTIKAWRKGQSKFNCPPCQEIWRIANINLTVMPESSGFGRLSVSVFIVSLIGVATWKAVSWITMAMSWQ